MDSHQHFQEVHGKAFWSDLLARIEGRPNDLLPYEELADILQTYQRLKRTDPEMIPLDRIVGSVGRYRDFTRDFLPRNPGMRFRWAAIEREMDGMLGLPPIEVFKVGDVFFVIDGNHRVSVARANGFDSIEAYVTEIPIDAELKPGDSLDEAILKAGRARFLRETGLEEYFPGLEDIRLTAPGGFSALLEQIGRHRDCMAESGKFRDPVTFRDAAAHWYTEVYLPIIAAIRRRKLLVRYPERTPADLYVWVSRTIAELRHSLSQPVSAEEAASFIEDHTPSPLVAAVSHALHRLTGLSHLFERGDGMVWEADSDSLDTAGETAVANMEDCNA